MCSEVVVVLLSQTAATFTLARQISRCRAMNKPWMHLLMAIKKKSQVVGSLIWFYLCKQSSSNSLCVLVTVCTVIFNPITFTEIL